MTDNSNPVAQRLRPTDAEFEELKRKRDEAILATVKRVCEEQGWDPATVRTHVSGSDHCYCACPDGPCQHIWDGPEHVSEDEHLFSATCSRCGSVAFYHDMRCAP